MIKCHKISVKRKHKSIMKCRESNSSQSEKLDFQNFPGDHAPDPPSTPTKFFSPLCGDQNLLELLLEPVKFWAGSAPELEDPSQLNRKGHFTTQDSGKRPIFNQFNQCT